ncbi:NAD(P)-binding domain-containing protein [Pseudonocardia aurantiaca]|uniref:NAD(P)-binding domain-containing protein n=1 Tax=Pseudonocardia aurantiaca TaxID=75290 RepID=A0ABW4FM53_9PSEU
MITARHPEHAAKVALDVGARPAVTAVEAVEGVEMVVLAVPARAIADVTDEIRRHLEGVIVVDPTNPLEPDLSGVLEARLSLAEEIAILLQESHARREGVQHCARRPADHPGGERCPAGRLLRGRRPGGQGGGG